MRLANSFPAILLLLAALSGCFGGGGDAGAEVTCDIKVTPDPDGVTFLFDATNSTPANANIAWNFGDEGIQVGSLAEYGLIEYEYAVTNTLFHVSIVVRDPANNACFEMETVTLGNGNNTDPTVFIKNTTRWVAPGAAVVLDASKSTDADQDFFSYEWTLGNFTGANNTVDTGYLSRGQSYNHTFAEEGVYDFHCHPHPWMKSRVVVSSDDPNATDGGMIKIANFTYEPKTYYVRPNSQVTWYNDDPVEHTATLEMFAPGKIVHTGPVFSARLETEGDYQAWLTLNDGKGGIVHQSWGLKAGADAPPSPWLKTWFEGPVTHVPGAPAGNTVPTDISYRSEWLANLTATIAWQDPSSGQNAGTARLQLLKDSKVLTECVRDGTGCTLQYGVDQGTYVLRPIIEGVHAQNAVNISTSAIQYTFPNFGDSGGCPPGWDLHPGQGCMKH